MSQHPDGGSSRQPPLRRPQLRVNPIACDAHGLCIELLPELITADPWGYPIITPGPVPLRLQPLARRAVAACPTLALMLTSPPR
ncbi:MAG TPA: ferredoxin [Streptosporangiaceae bacterium]|nr:ferredoxin [Streptosporangiaceae bacterium]